MNIKPGEQFDINKLKNPPLECAVSYSWLWNVPVTRELVDKSLAEIVKAGVKSLYIIPLPKDFRPETMRTFLDPEYLSERYFEIVKYALTRCVELGILPWLYDEGGWPSGGAAGITAREYPEAKTTMLAWRSINLGVGEKYKKCESFVALFDGNKRLSEDFAADRDVTLTEYYGTPNYEFPHFLDYTDPKMTDTFINNTYATHKKALGELFGTSIPLIFTDEPGLKSVTLPKGGFEGFMTRFGYDVRDYLYVLLDPDAAKNDVELRARMDYGKFVGELFIENTFKRLSRWCEENGIHYAGHIMADNYPDGGKYGYYSLLEVLRQLHIPGVDAIWEQIRFPYGGRVPYDSEETERMPFFPLLASSAARQRGRNLALTESMGVYGDGITPDEIKYVTNYQIIRGINVISYAHIPIDSTRYSALAIRPMFRPEKPGFYHLGHLNEYFARLSYLSRLGHREGDTALYHPSDDYFGNRKICNAAVDSFRDLGMALEEKNIAFDLIDDYGIREATDTGDGLLIGDALYRHIAVPSCKYMPEDVRKKILPYLSEGTPTYVPKSKKLRFMTRKLDKMRLWLVFNEGEPVVHEAFCFSEYKNVYRIYPENGDMEKHLGEEVTLLPGDIAVFLECDDEYPSVTRDIEYTVEAESFSQISHKRFVITYNSLSAEYGEKITPDSDFSGEITYIGSYSLNKAPKSGERYRIRLEGFSNTVSVRTGDAEFSLGLSPMEKIIDGASIAHSGDILITVANTALNEIKAKENVYLPLPAAERGPYLERLAVHEERVPELRFGKVYIDKLK